MTNLVALLVSWLAAAPVVATTPVLEVGGALPKQGSLTIEDLEALKPLKSTWRDHGEKHEVYGVPLERVLTQFGFEPGEMGPDVSKRDKRKGWKMAVVASAPDGFQTVLSCAEVFESMGPTRALVVWKIDGQLLTPERGPLRLVVLTDKEPSRSIRNLFRVKVVDLRDTPTP